jgi:hypothetical protein
VVDHVTIETVSPARNPSAMARQESLSRAIGVPIIEPEVSSTRVR